MTSSPGTPETLRDIEQLIKSERVVLFMKGTRSFPQCGFSAQVVEILNSLLPEYKTVNVLADPAVRQGVKDYSSWPTIPQLYVGGQFVGGCDIVRELYSSGELHKVLGVEKKEQKPPAIEVKPGAAAALREALAGAGPDDQIHLSVNGRFEHDLALAPRRPGDLAVESGGVTILVDAMSAPRLEGVVIDFVESFGGGGFRIDNPNAPPQPRPISPRELADKLASGELTELYDVRPPDEQAIARIAQARTLDPDAVRHIDALDKATPIAFYCHHGNRSAQACARFAAAGFKNVYNLAGGIDAWSRDVDPKVPRY